MTQTIAPQFIFAAAVVAVATFVVMGSLPDRPYMSGNYYKPEWDTQMMVDQEIASYNSKFGVSLPPIDLAVDLRDNDKVEAYYIAGVYAVWNDSVGHLFVGDRDDAVMVIFGSLREKSSTYIANTLRHELCHHYMDSICKKDMTNEESFCQGYASVSTGRFYEVYDLSNPENGYMDFYDKPLSFFECGFRTCSLENC